MNKRFGTYAIAWFVLLALFNVIALVPAAQMDAFSDSFWVGYAFITVTFIGQLICAGAALKESNAQKLFYRVSLISTSYTGLIVTFVFGGLCMLIGDLAYWVGIVVCAIVLACNALAVIKAAAAVGAVEKIDAKVKAKTFFVKALTVNAQTLIAKAQCEEVKAECTKVYEAVRYSDPMSCDGLAAEESQITIKFAALADAVTANDAAAVSSLAADVLILIQDRNNKCKLLK